MTARTVAALIAVAFLLSAGIVAATRAPTPTPASYAAPQAAAADRVILTAAQRQEADASGTWPGPLKSLLPVAKSLEYGDYLWNDANVPAGDISVRVDLRTQLMSVMRAGHEIGTAVVLYGADEKETPLGTFPVLWKGRNHRSSLYDAEMPFTMRLTGDGVAIHGSDVRWGAATHGCIGVPSQFAAKMFDLVKIGTPVMIVRTVAPPPTGKHAA